MDNNIKKKSQNEQLSKEIEHVRNMRKKLKTSGITVTFKEFKKRLKI